MHYLNDWHDYVRAVAFFVSLYSLCVLLARYRRGRSDWNTKTTDLWYALAMWCLSGCVFTVQGIVLDRPLSPGFVFLLAAIFVTGKGVHRKDRWGGDAS